MDRTPARAHGRRNLYPYPWIVCTIGGKPASSSILARSRRTCTSTVRSSPLEIETPHALEQTLARERNAGICRQFKEQRELARLEPDVVPVDARFARCFVDLEASKA